MSLDYPEYVELKKRKLWLLAFLWRVGDIGYYIGLLCALIGPLCMIGSFLLGWIQSEPTGSFGRAMFGALLMFIGFSLILVTSMILKGYARKRGAKYNVYS
jgi:hypothetical protein